MDTSSNPKRRGRKKKIESPEEKIIVPKTEQLQMIQAKNIVKSPENLQMEREKIVIELEERAREVDSAIDNMNVENNVYRKMRHLLYFDADELDDEIERIEARREEMEWQTVVQREYMRKVCKVLEFLLKNGPMSKIESDIFDRCIEVAMEYYNERTNFIENLTVNDGLRKIYMNTTFYPCQNSPVYQLFNEVLAGKKTGVILEYFEHKHKD